MRLHDSKFTFWHEVIISWLFKRVSSCGFQKVPLPLIKNVAEDANFECPVCSELRSDKSLLSFRGLSHDPQRILAAFQRLALVGIEGGVDLLRGIAFELGIATFADADERAGNLTIRSLRFCIIAG